MAETEKLIAEANRARFWLAAIVNSSDDAIISKDLNGIIMSWNAGAERIFEYTGEEAIGQPITLIIPEELRQEETEILRRLRAGQAIEHFETVRVAKSGRRINISLTISPIRDEEGRVIGASKIARDISRRVSAERALHNSQNRLRLAQAAARIGSWEWDPQSGASSLSLEVHEMFGTDPAQPNHQELWQARVHQEDLARVQEAMVESARTGSMEVEYRYYHPQQGLRWYFCKGRRFSEEESSIFGIILDISERKEAEAKLNAALGDLTQARDELELRVKQRTADLERAEESLRALSGRLLQAQDEERRRIARELHDSAGQLLTALNMNLVPLQNDAHKLGPTSVRALNESFQLIEQLSKELRTISHLLHPPMLDEAGLEFALQWYVEGFAERSNIEVDFELAADLGRLPRDAEIAIFRLVQESLTNIHRHANSPTASVRLFREGDEVQVRITDQGKGMPAEYLNGHRRARAGVGVQGMRERLRQLKGRLQIQSGPGGTTVQATIPAPMARMSSPAPAV